jgi:hypothetical protein
MSKKKTIADPVSGSAISTATPKKTSTRKKVITPVIESELTSGAISNVDTGQNTPSETVNPKPEGHTVVIPFLASKAKGEELIMAIRSWEKNFPSLARIVIIGDLPPQLKGKISHIPHKAESTNPQIDTAQKKAAAIASDLVPETFIWSNDDIFLISPLSFEDIAAKKSMDLPLKKRASSPTVYGKNTERTIHILEKEGIKNPHNYDSHLPFVFEKTKLAQTLAKFRCTQEGHLVATLYYNSHFPLARPIKIGNSVEGTVMASVWSANPNREILERVFETKQFINCNDNGWPHVERYLLRLFPKKSKFEN